ncbi:MAG: aminotransferase class I/II-fold pyridoxal phosphate-dependent enzyme [Mailhella sp.]|nr:aminotransferase class I/II-fold pyridoxal phosphate-dependent enzyme [Mailhella sp.]
MLSFESDYINGAHPDILRRLVETNDDILSGYGSDHYCRSASEKILDAFACPNGRVFFLTGGTQTNAVIIAASLKPFEGVLAADTGHIAIHEAGAIELSGHKVLTLPNKDGKIPPKSLAAYLEKFHADGNREHMVHPGMLYISHPTEYGTLYSLAELKELSETCRRYGIPVFLDGARLGYGLMSKASDVSASDVSRLCSVFTVGGTKVGALCGEAVVFASGGGVPDHFATQIKQRGALLAKGRLLGVQFDTLFTNGLYFAIAKHGIDAAEKLKTILKRKNARFYKETPTNQQFVILSDAELERLSPLVKVSFWEKTECGDTVVRFATSWSTSDEDLLLLEKIL